MRVFHRYKDVDRCVDIISSVYKRYGRLPEDLALSVLSILRRVNRPGLVLYFYSRMESCNPAALKDLVRRAIIFES